MFVGNSDTSSSCCLSCLRSARASFQHFHAEYQDPRPLLVGAWLVVRFARCLCMTVSIERPQSTTRMMKNRPLNERMLCGNSQTLMAECVEPIKCLGVSVHAPYRRRFHFKTNPSGRRCLLKAKGNALVLHSLQMGLKIHQRSMEALMRRKHVGIRHIRGG
jgi:hypothetical protein